jgi:hypothetical protein
MLSANNKEYTQYIQYDTQILSGLSRPLTLDLNLPKDGLYKIKVVAIALYFPDTYTPDPNVGYLVISGTQENQLGNNSIAGIYKNKQGGIVFPIYGLTNTGIRCPSHNTVFLHANESLTLNYYDGVTYTLQDITRISVLIHITNNIV